MNAMGKSSDLTLGARLSAKGYVIFTNLVSGRQKVTVMFSGLKPKGQYGLFKNYFDESPIGFRPLDGRGTDNNFVADSQGNAALSTYAPKPLTSDNAFLPIYHSDAQNHGQRRGNIGVDALHQIITKP